jgi:hypothetical protein
MRYDGVLTGPGIAVRDTYRVGDRQRHLDDQLQELADVLIRGFLAARADRVTSGSSGSTLAVGFGNSQAAEFGSIEHSDSEYALGAVVYAIVAPHMERDLSHLVSI